jgi:hypothetical protein
MLDENEFLSPYDIRALSHYHVEHPYVFRVGNQENRVSYLPAESDQVAEEITRRLTSIFRRDSHGHRPVYGGTRKFQEDPHWRDYLLFYEYFHGDNGAGLGASHQTGWTGVIARLMHVFATSTPEQFLELGKAAVITEVEPAPRGQSREAAPDRKR